MLRRKSLWKRIRILIRSIGLLMGRFLRILGEVLMRNFKLLEISARSWPKVIAICKLPLLIWGPEEFKRRHCNIEFIRSWMDFLNSMQNNKIKLKFCLNSLKWLRMSFIGYKIKLKIEKIIKFHQIKQIAICVHINYGWNRKFKKNLLNFRNI